LIAPLLTSPNPLLIIFKCSTLCLTGQSKRRLRPRSTLKLVHGIGIEQELNYLLLDAKYSAPVINPSKPPWQRDFSFFLNDGLKDSVGNPQLIKHHNNITALRPTILASIHKGRADGCECDSLFHLFHLHPKRLMEPIRCKFGCAIVSHTRIPGLPKNRANINNMSTVSLDHGWEDLLKQPKLTLDIHNKRFTGICFTHLQKLLSLDHICIIDQNIDWAKITFCQISSL